MTLSLQKNKKEDRVKDDINLWSFLQMVSLLSKIFVAGGGGIKNFNGDITNYNSSAKIGGPWELWVYDNIIFKMTGADYNNLWKIDVIIIDNFINQFIINSVFIGFGSDYDSTVHQLIFFKHGNRYLKPQI